MKKCLTCPSVPVLLVRDDQLVLHNRDVLLVLSCTAQHNLTVSLSLNLYLYSFTTNITKLL